jgi:transcriptional regulator with XRE-family HTH domain
MSTKFHMTINNEKLISILDREFGEASRVGKGPFDTVEQKAMFIGIDKASLSKYRTGKNLTPKKARQIAEKFRISPAEIAGLIEELLDTQALPSEAEREVHAWFKNRSNEETLMLVEFREVPVISPGQGNSELVKELSKTIAESVAAGLTYGMFLPFNLADLRIDALPAALLGYLLEIKDHVEKTYKRLQREILDHIYDEESPEDPDLNDKLLKAVQRLRLYVSTNPPSSSPGIGYRLFYVEEHGVAAGQQWEWISSPDDTYRMVQKNPSEVGMRAIATRFSPIPEFWGAKKRLPRADKELIDRAADLGISLSWRLFKSDDQKVVETFIKDKISENV